MASLAEQGILAKGSTAGEMKALAVQDRAKWAKLIKDAGIKPD